MPRFPTRPVAAGLALLATGVLLLSLLVRSALPVTLRLALLAPVLLSLLVASILLVFSVAAFRWRVRARREGAQSFGFVEAIERGRKGFTVRVRWRNGLGRELHFETPGQRERPGLAPGARVTVWVCEDDPIRYHYVDLGSGGTGARG